MAALNITPELIGIADAQKYLGGISRPTIYNLINRGEITRVNLGRRAMITRESLARYVDRLGAHDKQ